MEVAMERLSTGSKVTSTGDDPYGMLSGNRLAADIRWQNTAIKNIGDASSMTSAAETGMSRVSEALQRIRELAMQAANSPGERDASSLQLEVQELLNEIDRLSISTKYNGQSLLGRSNDDLSFQIGADERDVATLNLDNFATSNLGAYTYVSAGAGAHSAATTPTFQGDASITRSLDLIDESGVINTGTWAEADSAQEIAAAIHASASGSDVEAQARTYLALYSASAQGQSYALKINDIQTTNFVISDHINSLGDAVTAINQITGRTGVEAVQVENRVVLVSKTGADITVENTQGAAGHNNLRIQKLGFSGDIVDTVGDPVALDVAGGNDATLVQGSIKLSSTQPYRLDNEDLINASSSHFNVSAKRPIELDDETSYEAGKLTVVDNVLYQGNGTSAIALGTVDTANSDLETGTIRLQFQQPLTSSAFDGGNSGDTDLDGWNTFTSQISLSGQDLLNGRRLPVDEQIPEFTNGTPANPVDGLSADSAAFSISKNGDTANGSGLSVELKTGPLTMPAVGIVHGPYMQTQESVTLDAGDTLSFNWKGVANGSDFDAYGYLVDETTGQVQEVINATGSGGQSSDWNTANVVIEQPGDYKLVFIGGARNDVAVNFVNGDFNDGASGDTGIPGWELYNQQITLAGSDLIAGQAPPTDTIFPALTAGAAPHDTATASDAEFSSELSSSTGDGSGLALKLSNSGNTATNGIIHGPYVVSESAVTIQAGDTVSFDWQAAGGQDAYDVIGYVVNEDNGHVEELLNETGLDEDSATTWSTASTTISEAGNYKFVFVAGTWDASGGGAAGADLYIDNVNVASENVITSDGSALLIDEMKVTANPGQLPDEELDALAQRLFQSGEDAARDYTIDIQDTYIELSLNGDYAEPTLEAVASIDITTNEGASAALTLTNAALDQSAVNQAKVGALQALLDSRMERLLNINELNELSRSRVFDADYAVESAALAREQMIQQMGSFVLTNTQQIMRVTLDMLR